MMQLVEVQVRKLSMIVTIELATIILQLAYTLHYLLHFKLAIVVSFESTI